MGGAWPSRPSCWGRVVGGADGVYGRRAEREAARALARARGARFRLVWCEAPEAVLRERLRARLASGRDLSDAREDVLDLQLRHYEPPAGEPDLERRPWTA
jgi:predicted kinase